MPPLDIVAVPILQDNYAWIVFDPKTEEAAVVDPGEAAPVLAEADRRGWTIAQAWITHWHPDHTGGIADMKKAGATVVGPLAERDRIPLLDVFVKAGDVIRIGGHTARVIDTPGHTAGHVSFHFADDALLFPGDTLFAMGCGRLLEGTPADMFGAMQAFAAMPDETSVYPAHEYTQSNGRFALSVDAGNQALVERMKDVDARRLAGEPTLPTTIAQERTTNPFLRADSVDDLARLRAAKDSFRG